MADTVNIKGKQYTLVSARVRIFWERHPNYSINTELLYRDGKMVAVKASIIDENNRVRATGLAEENREATMINKTSALENCESSAVGRALGNFGLGGDGAFPSAEEITGALNQQASVVDSELSQMLDKVESSTTMLELKTRWSETMAYINKNVKEKKLATNALNKIKEHKKAIFSRNA